ncbi:MAG: hypothetical protein CMJ79_13790 [Planctomycetaceae bacterium]|nr:hypothetical protein [Planctomycetaceae bacterium]
MKLISRPFSHLTPPPTKRLMNRILSLAVAVLAFTALSTRVEGQSPQQVYQKDIQPIIRTYCYDCHNSDVQEGKVRLDNLNPDLIGGPDAQRWHHALDMINQGDMPPEDAEHPDAATLDKLTDWIQVELVKSIKAHRNSNRVIMRRMTREQYTNTLQELLGVDVNFGNALPEDAKSKSGFTNNGNVQQISPLHLDYYQKVAREALAQAIFTEKPAISRYRVKVGLDIGKELPNEQKSGQFGGYVSQPVSNSHIIPHVLNESGEPIFIDPATRPSPFNNILHNLGIGMRGSDRTRYEVVADGMHLDSAFQHVERAPGSWHAPSPNLKLLIRRDFPVQGNFAFRVTAARTTGRNAQFKKVYGNKELVTQVTDTKTERGDGAFSLVGENAYKLERAVIENGILSNKEGEKPGNNRTARFRFTPAKADLYHVEIIRSALKENTETELYLEFGSRDNRMNTKFKLEREPRDAVRMCTPLGIVSLDDSENELYFRWNGLVNIEEIVFTPLAADHKIRKEQADQIARVKAAALENNQRQAVLQVSLGNRTDDGQDSRTFDRIEKITTPVGEFKKYQFVGRLENLPTPQLDLNEMTSLSNILVLTVWNGDFIKNKADTGSSIIVQEVEFEAPYFPQWPPQSHTQIFFDSSNKDNPELYAREILERFITRAFRRPADKDELGLYYNFWSAVRSDYSTFEDGIRETLVAVLCSPNFIYLAEGDRERKSRIQKEYELASKMSYFLWNGPPDERLYELASQGQLQKQLSGEVSRMIQDDRSWNFITSFSNQWLKLYRHNEQAVDIGRYPQYTRYIKSDLELETYHFMSHLLKKDLSIFQMIDSDFVIVNQNLAEFYGIPDVIGTDFRAVPVSADLNRGGLLTQGSFLSGHSDGKQAHPIKRAVWMMERILGESPPPPPPNVPDLDPKDPNTNKLPIAEQLALHRDNVSCRNCHKKLDPYGLVFEDYNGAGLLGSQPGTNKNTVVQLPSGSEVTGVAGMKKYVLEFEREKFATSLVEHLMTFALGRDMSYVDEEEIHEIVTRTMQKGGSFQTTLQEIVTSPMFLRN